MTCSEKYENKLKIILCLSYISEKEETLEKLKFLEHHIKMYLGLTAFI